jgi:hypothetical protein
MTLARAALLLLILGLIVMLVGFGVDPLWPAQDATPEMTRRAAELAALAGWIYSAGMFILLGAVGCLIAAAIRRAWRN